MCIVCILCIYSCVYFVYTVFFNNSDFFLPLNFRQYGEFMKILKYRLTLVKICAKGVFFENACSIFLLQKIQTFVRFEWYLFSKRIFGGVLHFYVAFCFLCGIMWFFHTPQPKNNPKNTT